MSSNVNENTEPLSTRERVFLGIVKVLSVVFRVDLLDAYRRQGIYYDDYREERRLNMEPVSELREYWLKTYEERGDAIDEDYIPYCAWLVLRHDETINPDIIIRGEKNEDGEFEHEVDDGASDKEKKVRKEEILKSIDEHGFIDTVLEDDSN